MCEGGATVRVGAGDQSQVTVGGRSASLTKKVLEDQPLWAKRDYLCNSFVLPFPLLND